MTTDSDGIKGLEARLDAADVAAAKEALEEYLEKGGTPLSKIIEDLEAADDWQLRAEAAEAERDEARANFMAAEQRKYAMAARVEAAEARLADLESTMSRPVEGIQYRTGQEVFDLMNDRVAAFLRRAS